MSASTVFAPAREAVEAGRIPGATLGVVTAAGGRAVLCAGLAQREPEPVPLTRAHLFDLASLTKVILTTTEILRLLEAGRARSRRSARAAHPRFLPVRSPRTGCGASPSANA